MKDDWKQVFAVGRAPVTAIDVLLEPDATMLRHAAANNARLLKVFPKGFALDGGAPPQPPVLPLAPAPHPSPPGPGRRRARHVGTKRGPPGRCAGPPPPRAK